MIEKETIRAAHQELGLPTDDDTVDKAWYEILDAASDRMHHLHYVLFKEWKEAHPEAGNQIPFLDGVALWEQARIRADEEILEEWINEPVRAAISRREDAAADNALLIILP